MITDFDEDPDFPSAYPVEFNRTDQWSPKDVLVDASRHTRGTRNSYTMGCPTVRGDNPRALASGLSYAQVDKHGMTILYHLHQCRPCTS